MFNAFLDAHALLEEVASKKRKRDNILLPSVTDANTSGTDSQKIALYVGPLTVSQRKHKVDRYLAKRARMLKNRVDGKNRSTHQYAGRTKFANARRRVKGRFVTLEFMQKRGIKFDSEKPGWVCSTLNGRVFLTADEAVKAVDKSDSAIA